MIERRPLRRASQARPRLLKARRHFPPPRKMIRREMLWLRARLDDERSRQTRALRCR